MSTWYCSAYYNGEEFDAKINNATTLAEAEHAFEQHLWMEYELTKDAAKGWIVVDTDFMPCDD
jgi:hypothetical protein